MLFQTVKFVDGKAVLTDTKVVDQSKLTSECWLIQIQGLKACEGCPCMSKKTGMPKTRGEHACGGVAIHKRLRGL